MSNQSVTAGMSWREIAKSAYLAYAASTDNKNYQGLPMPKFEDLTVAIQTAWECAVRQTGDCLLLTGEHHAGNLDEQKWAEWTKRKLAQK